jgi:outer membrane protein OmpA-like peptidoglycan-associated protein
VIVANSGFITEAVVADEAGLARRAAGESMPQFLQRLQELEKSVQARRIVIRPELANGEICPRLLFDFDQSSLTPESTNLINRKLGPWLRTYHGVAGGGLIVEGWADSVGSTEACQRVSQQRAENVAKYIAETLGCRVKAIGRGKSFDPPNTSEVNKQQNRRVVIKAAEPAVPAATGSGPPATPAGRRNR